MDHLANSCWRLCKNSIVSLQVLAVAIGTYSKNITVRNHDNYEINIIYNEYTYNVALEDFVYVYAWAQRILDNIICLLQSFLTTCFCL